MPVDLRQGQFHWVRDDMIAFPEDRERLPHPTARGCVIVEGDESLSRGGKRVLIVPTSHQTDRKETYDVVIPNPPAPKSDCVALVQHVQPILRTDLTNFVARLPQDYVDAILGALLKSLGIDAEEEIPF